MDQSVKENAKLSVLQFIKGQGLERNKLEFKRQWYKLNWKVQQEKGQKAIHNYEYYEFIKDCVAIINSYGREAGVIVIGVDEGSKNLFNTSIADCGLSDPSQVKDIIIGNVDKAFLIDIDYIEVEGKQLSIIYIPPSIDKPHLITEYWSKTQNRSDNVIWIKNGSGAMIAGRGDIDRMYWERSNIVLDKRIEVAFDLRHVEFATTNAEQIIFVGRFSIENTGTRRLLITRLEIAINVGNAVLKFFNIELEYAPLNMGPNEPIHRQMAFNHHIRLNERGVRDLAENLNREKSNYKYESIIATLGNHEKIFIIPIVAG